MTATKPEIRPRFVDGEPVCSGEECPAFPGPHKYVWQACVPNDMVGALVPCIPGLRAQRDALLAERDALAHEVAHPADAEEIAKLRKERDGAKYDRDVEKTVNRQLVEFCRKLATGNDDNEERLASIIGMDGRWD
jgi:hypothetical protein